MFFLAPREKNRAATLRCQRWYRHLAWGVIGLLMGSSGMVSMAQSTDNYVLQLDGSNDFVKVGTHTAHLLTGDVTLEVWIKLTSYPAATESSNFFGHIITRSQTTTDTDSDEANNTPYSLSVASDGTLSAFHEGAGGSNVSASSTGIIALDTWTHIAVVRDVASLTYQFFINGVGETPVSYSENPVGGENSSLNFGSTTLGSFVDGQIDDVRIWDIMRTEGEIQSTMGTALTGSESGLIGYWPFDEGTGLTAADGTTHALDGTLTNGPIWMPLTPNVTPATGTLYWPLDVITVDIDVSSTEGILGFSTELIYDAGRMTFDDGSLAAGGLIDDGSTLDPFEDDDDSGTVALSLTRTSGSGTTGDGTIGTMTFSVNDYADPGATKFTLNDLLAIDATGAMIGMIADTADLEIGGVWPGDTDNNCVVEAADLLNIGLLFGTTGPARLGDLDLSWSAKAFSPWTTFDHSFADATGDGEIDQKDVLGIGLNFDEVHDEATGCTPAAAEKRNMQVAHVVSPYPVGTLLALSVQTSTTQEDLVGVAFGLSAHPGILAIRSVEAGSVFGEASPLSFVRLDEEAGTGDAAFSLQGQSTPVAAGATLATVYLEVVGSMTAPAMVYVDQPQTSRTSAGVSAAAWTLHSTVLAEGEDMLPGAFVLHGAYPNPFNPATTISFDLPVDGIAQLTVFDMLGRVVRQQQVGEVTAGSQRTVSFSADGLSSGVYIYRLSVQGASGHMAQTGRFTLLK